jgi:hypothetical protein
VCMCAGAEEGRQSAQSYERAVAAAAMRLRRCQLRPMEEQDYSAWGALAEASLPCDSPPMPGAPPEAT